MEDTLKIIEQFEKLPKYIRYKDDCYVPIIYKHENSFHDRAYWAMYAKELMNGFSSKKVLFHVKASLLGNVLWQFECQFDHLCVEKIIRDCDWFGNEPYEIDFCND